MVEREDGSLLVAGQMAADALAERLGIDLPEDRDYATVAGLALAVFRHLPGEGESFVEQGWKFEVVDLDGRRIDKLLVSEATQRRERCSRQLAERSLHSRRVSPAASKLRLLDPAIARHAALKLPQLRIERIRLRPAIRPRAGRSRGDAQFGQPRRDLGAKALEQGDRLIRIAGRLALSRTWVGGDAAGW